MTTRPAAPLLAAAALVLLACSCSVHALPRGVTLTGTQVAVSSSPPPPSPSLQGALSKTWRGGGIWYNFNSPPPPPCYTQSPPPPPPPCYQSPPPPPPPPPASCCGYKYSPPPPPPPPPCYQPPPPPPSPPPPCPPSPPPPPPPPSPSPPPPPPPCYQPPPPPPPCYQPPPPPPPSSCCGHNQSPPPPPPPCYQQSPPPPPCSTKPSPPPPTSWPFPNFPYQNCYYDSTGTYKFSFKGAYFASHDETRYCFNVRAKQPDPYNYDKCRNFDLWSINFRVHIDCYDKVSYLTYNGQQLQPSWAPNLPPTKAMLQVKRGNNQVLDTQGGIASNGGELCFTLPNYCPLDKFCKGDHCKAAFYPTPYSGLNCCPGWDINSRWWEHK